MNETLSISPTSDDGRLADAPGTTMTLTAEGWEASEYLEPGDDWVVQADGSFCSPDGATRTWLLSSEIG